MEKMELAKKKIVPLEPKPTTRELKWRCTDDGNAHLLVELAGGTIRHVANMERWLVWSGSRWTFDDMERLRFNARRVADHLWTEAYELPGDDQALVSRHALASRAGKSIRAMIDLASSVDGVKIFPDSLDADPWLLTVGNGTVDLRTGELREHRRSDYITKASAHRYDPDAMPEIVAPRWMQFLEEIMPDAETRDFLARAVGYSLSGSVREQCLFILHGSGSNGKSTLIEALEKVAGDYGFRTPSDTLLLKRSDGIPNDLAALRGARLVVASETEDGRRLAEARVKELVGGDSVSARFMRGEWFSFKPTCKLWLSTNHRPNVRGTDHAIWRRVRLIPFDQLFGEGGKPIDKELPAKLEAEMSGILSWAIRGAVAYQERGLDPPETVLAATKEYQAEQDTTAAFIAERCEIHSGFTDTAGNLYAAYVDFCRSIRETPATQRAFGARLTALGYETDSVWQEKKTVRIRRGLRAQCQQEHR